MSDAHSEPMDHRPILDAVSQAIADNRGGMVTAFLGIIDYIDRDGEPCFQTVVSTDQRVLTTLGLAEALSIMMRGQVDAVMREDE